MKECDILGGQYILRPLLHVLRGSGPSNPRDPLRPCRVPCVVFHRHLRCSTWRVCERCRR